MKFIDPRIDFAFKKIFGGEESKDILISFLESLMGLTGDRRIAELTILDPFLAPRILAMKGSILDVRCRDLRGISYIVEMQVQKTGGFLKRIQFNAAKAYVGQISLGGDYPTLQQVIAITLTDFVLFKDLGPCVSYHETREAASGLNLLDGILYYFIELPKFTKPLEELVTPLDKWIFFIKMASRLKEIPPILSEPPFLHAFEVAQESAMDKEEFELYEKASIAATDARGALELAMEQGLEQGRQKGRQEGRLEGRLEGRQQGEAAVLLRQLRRRFGQLPDAVMTRIAHADLKLLETWSDRILEARSLDDVFA